MLFSTVLCELLLFSCAFAASVDVWQTLLDGSSKLSHQGSLNSASGNSNAYTAVTIGSTTYQEMYGYGGTLTESTTYNLMKMKNGNSGAYKSVLNALFSTSSGAGFTMLRVPMGSTDMSMSPAFTYAMTWNDQLFANWSWNRDAQYMLPVLKDIIAINSNVKIIVVPWTAPSWLKDSNQLNNGNIKSSAYDDFAYYFQVTIQKFKSEGINVHALSVQNEPLHSGADYPAMGVSASASAQIIKLIATKLSSVGLGSIKILAYDHNWDHPEYPNEVISEAGQYVSATAWHCYGGDVSAQLTVKNAHPDKEHWFTECAGTGPSNFNGNIQWNTNNLYFGSVRNWASTVLHWAYAVDSNYGPHSGGCPNCRGIVTVHSDFSGVTYNEEYYGMAQFSKFLKYPAHRLQCDLRGGYNCVTAMCFKNADGSILTVIANFCQTPQQLAIQNGGSYVTSTAGVGLTSYVW